MKSEPRELAGGVLFLGAIVAALVLAAVGIGYGWGAGLVLVAFVAGALLLAND